MVAKEPGTNISCREKKKGLFLSVVYFLTRIAVHLLFIRDELWIVYACVLSPSLMEGGELVEGRIFPLLIWAADHGPISVTLRDELRLKSRSNGPSLTSGHRGQSRKPGLKIWKGKSAWRGLSQQHLGPRCNKGCRVMGFPTWLNLADHIPAGPAYN